MRKRVSSAPVLTLASRISLKRSIDDGNSLVYDVAEKRGRTLPDVLALDDGTATIKMLSFSGKKLGNGVYGQVMLLESGGGGDSGNGDVAAKVIGCSTQALGSIDSSPFRSERIEPALVNYLWKHFVMVEPPITPHLIAPFGTHAVLPGSVASQRKEDADLSSSLVYFMEHAAGRDMRSYLTHLNGRDFDLHFRVLLFQVTYTMGAIFMRIPNFRHNDLKDDNILLHKSPPADTNVHTSYEFAGRTFYLPPIGVQAMIADFDFASIGGQMFDNFKTMEQEWDTPSYNITTRQDQTADICCLAVYLIRSFGHRMGSALKEQMVNVFEPMSRALKANGNRHLPNTPRLPSPWSLLMETDLFDCFLLPSAAVGERYEASLWDAIPPRILDPTIDWSKDRRHCPVFRARRPRRGAAAIAAKCPSAIYFEHCKPAHPTLDKEAAKEFQSESVEDIINLLATVYDDDGDGDDDVGFYALDPDATVDFFDRVREIGRRFLVTYFVPQRWWYVAYSCAFMDVLNEMSMVPPGQRCWFIERWTSFWEEQGRVRYTDLQFLHFHLQWTWLEMN